MAGIQVISGRYEVKDAPIGQGGMGVVYKAYDSVTKRYVALKTMWGIVDPAAIELFEREWTVLARLSHPNIVDILDTGEFKEEGQRRPYFVMPLLPGVTLDHLIKSSSQRLTVERTVEIMCQACRGLQAAHDQGLVHRDLKPSNIFVMDDDTVKIIDFGVVHLADTRSVTGIKGTLQYMAPEQLEMKPSTPLSDIFSLGVVCYEAFTGRKPFARKTETEVAEAIRTYIPPPASEINAAVNQLVSRTVHKAMAKQPWHRFSNAKEFSDTLQKAMRNEPIERFDRTKIQPRIDRIKKAHGEMDFQFAMEILTELESEGHIDPEMSLLRIQIDQSIRQKTIRQLIESARTRMEEDELPLALQKVQDVLNIDPTNVDALSIRSQIERQRSEKQVDNWFRLVRQHIDNQLFSQARQGIQEVLKINSSDSRARQLLAEIDRTEQELIKVREEKQKLYESAVNYYQNGEISTALNKLEQVLDLTRRLPKTVTPDRDAQYQGLYNQIRSERDAAKNAYAEGRKQLSDRHFSKTLEICNEYLQKHAGDPMFQALKIEAEELQRQEQSAAIADVNRRVELEADLDKKMNIIKEAVDKYPDEPHFKQSLKLVRDRRDLVNSIVGRARQYEERGQFNDAAGQWDILRNIYSQYPGLQFEVERLSRRRQEQAQEEAKSRWVEKIDRHLGAGEYAKAREVVKEALVEFSDDRELQGLDKLAEQAIKRSAESAVFLKQGQALCAEKNYTEGLEALRKAERLDDRNPVIRGALLSSLIEHARGLMTHDWRQAKPLVDQALELDGSDPIARSLSSLIENYKRQEIVGQFVLEARALQAAGDLSGALSKVEEGLAGYPTELRLSQLHSTLRAAIVEDRRTDPKTRRQQEDPAVLAPPPPAKDPEPEKAKNEFVNAPQPAPDKHTAETVVQTSPTNPPLTSLFPASSPAAPPKVPEKGKKPPPPPPPAKPAASASAAKPPVAPPPPPPAKPLVDAASKQPVPPTVPGQSAGSKKFPLIWVIAVAAAVLVIVGSLLYTKLFHHPVEKGTQQTPVTGGRIPVTLAANAPNAHFTVDGKETASPSLNLAPGEYKIEARADGYRSDVKTVTVPKDGQGPINVSFNLVPTAPELRINSDVKAGKFVLDSGEPADLQEGLLSKDDLGAGDHTLKILDGSREVLNIGFHFQPGALPVLTAPLNAKTAPGEIVSSYAGSAKVYAPPGVKGGLVDQPMQPIPPEGLSLTGLTANSKFMVDDGKGQPHAVSIEYSAAPVLNVFLTSASDRVPLLVKSNVPDGVVMVNDKRLKRTMVKGSLSLKLSPGTYVIKVVHDDYQAAPEQKLVIKAGDTNVPDLNFELTPMPHGATLAISSAPPDAEVFLDDSRIGAAKADGSLSSEAAVGSHKITIRKQGYEEYSVTREFKAGETTRIAAELKQYGSLAFNVQPPGARITYRGENEEQAHDCQNGQSITLKPGKYEVSAAASGFVSMHDVFTVLPGKATSVTWPMKATGSAPAPPPSGASAIFDNGAEWGTNGGWWVHRGPGHSYFKKTQGSYSIDILRQSSGGLFKKQKKIVFVVDYKNDRNKIVYTLDDHQFRRKIFSSEGDHEELKIPHGMEGSQYFGLILQISPERIVVKTKAGRVLDSLARSGPLGRIGFEDQVDLQVIETQ